MKITGFEKKSTAASAGFRIGDVIFKINGHPIQDSVDFQFHVSDEQLQIEIIRDGEHIFFEIEKDYDDYLDIIFEDIQYRCCGNKCIFCFVDQNPMGLRESLYFKDEDFRLSFIYGNYVTLTNVSRSDLNRIVEQRLSPLYISVHSTDLEVRKLLLGLKKDDHLLDKIKFLSRNHIELHAQIVLCPAINDGASLNKTIRDLAKFYPQLKSIAVVPVGLTKHRRDLYPLRSVTGDYAQTIILRLEKIAQQFKQKWDHYFIYLADEFYILARQKLPSADRYEDFPQIENGVGMMRNFIDRFEEQSHNLPHRITNQRSVTLVSAKLASPLIDHHVVTRLNKIDNLCVDLITIENSFYGKGVTVTGLLTGHDIYHQLHRKPLGDIVVLPANCLNDEGLFLDDWTIEMLENNLQRHIKIVDYDFNSLLI